MYSKFMYGTCKYVEDVVNTIHWSDAVHDKVEQGNQELDAVIHM